MRNSVLIRFSKLYACLVFVLTSMAIHSNSETPVTSGNDSNIEISLKDNLVSIESTNVPLHQLIHEIGKKAGFKTILADEFFDAPVVNVSFNNISVIDAIDRLVSDKNRIIFFKPANDISSQSTISQVWLLGSMEGGERQGLNHETVESNYDNTFAFAQENVVNNHKLVKLAGMLQQDQPEALRTRAAIALGKFADESGVVVLEPALLDNSAAVRSEVIKSLGSIGGHRATMLLGNVLNNKSIDTSERVIAARSLLEISTEQANAYLRAAQHDSDELIRQVAGLSSVSNKSLSTANNKDSADIQ